MDGGRTAIHCSTASQTSIALTEMYLILIATFLYCQSGIHRPDRDYWKYPKRVIYQFSFALQLLAFDFLIDFDSFSFQKFISDLLFDKGLRTTKGLMKGGGSDYDDDIG